MKRIGFDLDGVILDHSETIVDLSRSFGHNLRVEQTNSVDMKAALPEELLEKINERLYTDIQILSGSRFMADAELVLTNLKASGAEMYLLSRRSKETGSAIVHQFELRRFFDNDKLYFVDNSKDKLQIAQNNKIAFYVDDQPRILTGVLNEIEHKYLFDQFGHLPSESSYAKVSTWAELQIALD